MRTLSIFNFTLRVRIFLSMILIIIVSFLVTGLIYFQHFKRENELYHQERLRRKEYAIIQAINYFLRDEIITSNTDSIVRMFDNKICELAKINSMDVNIYSLRGELLITSNPELYHKKIIPEELARTILNSIAEEEEQLMVSRRYDSISYLSTYDYVRNSRNQPIAILNLPYFDSEKERPREEENDFLVRLGQTYAVLFIIAGLLAYFLSNYITGSLKAIGYKLKNIKINENNPPLKWRFNDEIGALVTEYNRMLNELERSATILAQKERESAWREMAKQVAHEIKNPLTPMRLNVQHLERSLKTTEPEKLKEFTSSMISQIDALSSISEAFSRFATMPELKLEEFEVNELIRRTTALYPKSHIEFVCADPHVKIISDKDQLLRVMNNLINNALQAVPPEREPRIKVSLKAGADEVLISVEDNGVGISKEQGDKIFEPRFTTKSGGMGLGLAMVRNIVNGFGGKVWFDSVPGEGSTFFISLPRQKSIN